MSLDLLAQHGTGPAWLFIPTAIALGALHGLEPGHSKTMMAAFIIAVRGTVGQAVLLGLAATFSHTLVVWAVALIGMKLGATWNANASEPYFQMASAVMIIVIAVWMVWRTWRGQQRVRLEHQESATSTNAERRRIDTGHGIVALELVELDMPPRWRFHVESGHSWPAQAVKVQVKRPDSSISTFSFVDRGDHLESLEVIPEPHDFSARLQLNHGRHSHDYDVEFREHDDAHAIQTGEHNDCGLGDGLGHGQGHAHSHAAGHHHDHEHVHEPAHGHRHRHHHASAAGLDVLDSGQHDAHELAHADDIRKRFSGREVTTSQIVVFGLTGGLLPCPSAITVLLLCLQLKRLTLGVVLVLAFSVGLALTMVTFGVVASLSLRHLSRRWAGFDGFVRKAPYFSGAVIVCIGLFVGWQAVADKQNGGRHHLDLSPPISNR